jgi:hypothetical protein
MTMTMTMTTTVAAMMDLSLVHRHHPVFDDVYHSRRMLPWTT